MSCGSTPIAASKFSVSQTAPCAADNHISYGAAMVGVATAKTPCGPFTYKGSFKPLGADSRDESIFQDSESCRAASIQIAGY